MEQEYAVVIPFYSGRETIGDLVARIRDLTALEIIIVNDSGYTQMCLDRILSEFDNIRVVESDANNGQHYATVAGIHQLRGKHVITMDEDLQHDPECISRFIQEHRLGKAQVIYADRNRSGLRSLAHFMVAGIFFSDTPKTTCSYRLIDRSIVEQIVGLRPAYYQLEGMIMAAKPSYGYIKADDSESQRPHGSTYSIIALIRLISNLIAFYSTFPWVAVHVALLITFAMLSFLGGILGLLSAIPPIVWSAAILVDHRSARKRTYPRIEDLKVRSSIKVGNYKRSGTGTAMA